LLVGSKDQPLEVSIIPIPQSQSRTALLDNVNRWRRQMGLTPVDSADLEKHVEHLELAEGTAVLVDIVGHFGGMSGDVPLASEQPPAAAKPKPRSQVECALPKKWHKSKQDAFSLAAFEVRDGDQAARITVSMLGGDGGGLLANVNRWRAQAAMPGISPDSLKQHVETMKVDGIAGSYVEAIPSETKPGATAVLGWIGIEADHSWFVKMRGDAALVRRQQASFRSFLKSLHFPAR